MGVALLLAGIAALNRVRMEIPLEKENQEKLVKFMIRIGVFSVLYLVPLLSVLACYLYENSHIPASHLQVVLDALLAVLARTIEEVLRLQQPLPLRRNVDEVHVRDGQLLALCDLTQRTQLDPEE